MLKQVVGFVAIATVAVGLVITTLFLLSDDTLRNARANSDTINMNIVFCNDEKKLSVSQVIKYRNRTGEPLGEVKFHIYANAYMYGAKNPPIDEQDIGQAFPNGKSFGGITIHNINVAFPQGRSNRTPEVSATAEANTEIVIDGVDDTVLIVAMPSVLQPNHVTHITINYTVQLANVRHRLGWTDTVVNLANFYPVPVIFENGEWQTNPYSANGDPFHNAVHNFDVTITKPSELIMAHSGSVMRTSERNGLRTTRLESTAIRDFAMVLSPYFQSVERRVSGVLVRYFFLEDYDPKASLEISVKSLRTFSDLFTPYPFRQLTVVQTDFLHGGMEYGELVYVSKDFLTGEKTDREQHNYVIVHEIAHQWWYGLVGNNQNGNAWIDEGLAEFSTMLFFDMHPQFGVCANTIVRNARENLSAFMALVRDVGGDLCTNMNRPLGGFNSMYEYVFMTYVRGLLLFADLETIIGRDNLVGALSYFARTYKFQIAGQQNLVGALERSTNVALALFFEHYTRGWTGLLNI
ncbi:MAG: M1 family metallopeptidase [Firmicutes bacterium]|nr:M1 family metallopeptidase [Bacillota bacterium]